MHRHKDSSSAKPISKRHSSNQTSNINQLNSAIAHFNSCIEHKYNTFYEEANWYKAISLFEKKDKSSCIEILNKIIQGKGFYTKRAEELMSKMQKDVNN